ncbi:MAG: tol-pal system protein YbgF [Alphaproteobacteria bacterium]|nr:MAG: tol-pal system protein YbgF [Alphaproteobacteria bacterium]TAF14400.1 MAG: tol-pal system protein YbgF [Alphaproteobacteria bacterium]TAF40112.1 MAG: tol-pal system protein YbgF [Alphaproteobacteria bacterium]TAF77544.1 MAG: tol-pal system protein YbgF [Alphaproteobacteria bacterium]
MMKLSSLTLSALSVLTLIIASPAHAQRIPINLDGRLSALERRLDSVQSQGGTSGTASTSLSSMQVELATIREELRVLRGEIEENKFGIEQIQRQVKSMNEDVEYRLQELESANMGTSQPANAAASEPSNAPEVPAAETTTLEDQKKTSVPSQELNATVADIPSKSSGAEPSPAEEYGAAITLIKEQRYKQAQTSLNTFIANHASHHLSSNAYYWLGETYYVHSDFLKAADTFRRGFEHQPNGTKAADNLYKLSKSLIHMNKKREACVVLKQLRTRYKDRNPEIVGLAYETEKTNACDTPQ